MKYIIIILIIGLSFVAGSFYENDRIYNKCLTDNTQLVFVNIVKICGAIVER